MYLSLGQKTYFERYNGSMCSWNCRMSQVQVGPGFKCIGPTLSINRQWIPPTKRVANLKNQLKILGNLGPIMSISFCTFPTHC